MADRGKVITGLECCVTDGRDSCKKCYQEGPGFGIACIQGLMRDALELLKGQEPAIMPIPYQQDTSIGFFAEFKCGECNAVVFPDYRFCPMCGKAVKWE